MSQRVLNDGSTWEVFKRYFTGAERSRASSAAARCSTTGRWFVVVARVDAPASRRYRSLASLKRDQRVCRACVEAGYPLESLPVIAPRRGPARVPVRPGARASSRARSAGRGAAAPGRRCAAGSSWTRTSSTRRSTARRSRAAIPGEPASGRGDRTPTPAEQQLCAFWRDQELRLLRPQLIVTVGGLAARRLLGVKSVTECVGVRYELDGAIAIPLPHPSGREQLAERAREPGARRRRGRARASRAARLEPRGTLRRVTETPRYRTTFVRLLGVPAALQAARWSSRSCSRSARRRPALVARSSTGSVVGALAARATATGCRGSSRAILGARRRRAR